ncbi:MAG: restriction endonuclease subunit S [Sphingobacteriaceae bacterium]|nr:MAG: restriction endonuclease subunit S [Sphingobacteriaceae bacterium]
MNSSQPEYEKYKDSGVEWLGEIPEHWEVKKLKHIFFEKKKKTNPALNSGSISFGKVVIKNDEKIPISTKASYQEVLKGDFLVNPLNLNYDLISLRIALSYIDVVVSSGYIVLNSTKVIDKEYFKYLLHRYDVAYMKLLGSGVRQTINFNDIADSLLAFPPIQEQTAIASFIDQKTAKIDQAIAQKVKLIELLKERRQILIHHAVTKGLDDDRLNCDEDSLNYDFDDDRNTLIAKSNQSNQSPSQNQKKSKFRPSGVEWIGEIPEHWEVKRLKYLLIGKLKYGANESGIEYHSDLPRYVRITDFGQDGKLSEDNKLSLTWEKGNSYLLKDGDILFARSGATVGKTYQFKKTMSIENNYSYAGYLIKAEANESIILSDFLYLYTNSPLFNIWKEGIFIKATIENIGADKYAQLPVILPSISEQHKILENFNQDSTKIATAISLKEKEIEKLKEYKATLINSAVTGKIKVSHDA